MKRNIEKWGYEDVMKHVWFCHTPLYCKPCGLCHPCELKIQTGMNFLFPNSAIKRYKRKNDMPYKRMYIIERKINIRIHRLINIIFKTNLNLKS